MPLVTIETRRGLPPVTKRQLFDATHDALMAAFKIPDHDRGQRLLEYAPEDFEIPPGRGERFTIVTIEAFAGRSIEAKRALYRELVNRFEAAGVPKTDVFIVLKEIPMENWGLRGGIAGCDIDFGFQIRV
jgi:phenylpyruvate tautomerase PptA (4-oxalocrotonate tautomerase family)